MEKLRIYKIREGYIEFLHERDRRVQFNKGERRPYLGIVLEINGHKYFAPMESPKESHKTMKQNIHFMKICNGDCGIIGFNNMVPAKEFFLIPFDIEREKDTKYRNLLRKQIKFCNAHREEILNKAEKTYEAVTEKRIPFFVSISCNFKRLEQEYVKYYFKTTK